MVQLMGAAVGGPQPAEYIATAVLIFKGTAEVRLPHLWEKGAARRRRGVVRGAGFCLSKLLASTSDNHACTP